MSVPPLTRDARAVLGRNLQDSVQGSFSSAPSWEAPNASDCICCWRYMSAVPFYSPETNRSCHTLYWTEELRRREETRTDREKKVDMSMSEPPLCQVPQALTSSAPVVLLQQGALQPGSKSTLLQNDNLMCYPRGLLTRKHGCGNDVVRQQAWGRGAHLHQACKFQNGHGSITWVCGLRVLDGYQVSCVTHRRRCLSSVHPVQNGAVAGGKLRRSVCEITEHNHEISGLAGGNGCGVSRETSRSCGQEHMLT